MSDDQGDELLRRLGRIAAADEALSAEEQELERYCAGELPDERVRSLEARAEHDPAFAQLLVAYRPLAPSLRARVAGQLVGQMAAPVPGAGAAPAAAPRPRRVSRPWSRAVWASATGALAMAAGLALWIRNHPVEAPMARELPAYHAEITGGDREQRGPAAPPAGPIRLRPRSRLEVVLRPATALAGPVAVESFLAPEGSIPAAALEPVSLPVAISPSGAVRVAGVVEELFGARRGRWRLLFLLRAGEARPDPTQSAERVSAAADGGPGWQRLGVELLLVDSP